jgi:hypothetical protein
MDLRLVQSRRIERLRKYHELVNELEAVASVQTEVRGALEVHSRIEKELTQAEEDRQALLKQRDKVRAMLEGKRAERERAVNSRK